MLERVYGAKALERMHLRAPAFVRFLGGNPYPRMMVTHRPSLREADWAYGPFPSRAAAERFAEETLKLFLLRRCMLELNPDPELSRLRLLRDEDVPGALLQGLHATNATRKRRRPSKAFLRRAATAVLSLRAQRDEASANLAFEAAAASRSGAEAEAVRALAAELVRPLSRLRAVILQASAQPGEVAVFRFENGRLRGPAAFSTVGMRIQNEQSGSTSLFAQPMALEPVPEAGKRPEIEDQRSNQGCRHRT